MIWLFSIAQQTGGMDVESILSLIMLLIWLLGNDYIWLHRVEISGAF